MLEGQFILSLFLKVGGEQHAGDWDGRVIRGFGDEIAKGRLGILVVALSPERPG